MSRNYFQILVFLAFLQCGSAAQAEESAPMIEVKQGEAVFFSFSSDAGAPSLEARFLGRKIYFDRLKTAGKFGALLGIDLIQSPSDLPVTFPKNGERIVTLHIVPNRFGREEINVPNKFVNPSSGQLKRIIREQREIRRLLSNISPNKYWSGDFSIPVAGVPKGTFGLTRVFNGEPRNPHTGEDIAAPERTPVYASNAGIVAGVVNHFFSGKGIIIDHGHGVFTEYFHLHTVEVKKGERLKKGEEIGLVGKTGRATGPHLHWGMIINGARVNPLSAVKLKLE